MKNFDLWMLRTGEHTYILVRFDEPPTDFDRLAGRYREGWWIELKDDASKRECLGEPDVPLEQIRAQVWARAQEQSLPGQPNWGTREQ